MALLDRLRFRLFMLRAASRRALGDLWTGWTLKPIRGADGADDEDDSGKDDDDKGTKGAGGDDDKGGEGKGGDEDEDDPDRVGAEDDWKTKSRKNENRAKRERKRREEAEEEARKLKEANQSESEKAIAEAEKKGREAAESEAQKERKADRLEVAVTRLASKKVKVGEGDEAEEVRFADTEDALIHIERAISRGEIDEDDIFDDKGRVDTDALQSELGQLLERKPHLRDGGGGKGGGSGDPDTRKGDTAKNDLESMSPEDHAKRKYSKK